MRQPPFEGQSFAYAGARAAAMVLLALMFETMLDGLAAVVEFAAALSSDSLLSLHTRIALVTGSYLVGFAAFIVAIRFASRPRIPRPRPTLLWFLGALAVALFTAGSHLVTVLLPMWTAERVGARGMTALAEWTDQSLKVALFAIGLRATTLIGAFLYGAWCWWSTARACTE
ncbi:MAG: hypothetical protein HOV80_10475 [Polyangiaceae bacterium]|nr:hypothetical protein [Polyangiaceae bacterium]